MRPFQCPVRTWIAAAAACAAIATMPACSKSGAVQHQAQPSTQSAANTTPAPVANATTAPLGNQPDKIDIDAIFPKGPGRELLLNNCTSCHTFVPIVVLQMSKDAWEKNKRIHRSRVDGMSDEDFETLYEYLIANFNPQHPVPKLHKEFLDTWTSY